MSNPNLFSDVTLKDKSNGQESIENNRGESNCPSCNFDLSKHSAKQIVNCALMVIRGVRN